jgi:hypothetical protein
MVKKRKKGIIKDKPCSNLKPEPNTNLIPNQVDSASIITI